MNLWRWREKRRQNREFAAFRKAHQAEVERRRIALFADLNSSQETALVLLTDLSDTFFILNADATGDLAEQPQVVKALDEGYAEVVVAHG